MTDKQIIEALIARDERVTQQFFFGSCRPLFLSIIRYIVSASNDNTIKLWEVPSLQNLIDKTRERFRDNPLTDKERKEFYLEKRLYRQA